MNWKISTVIFGLIIILMVIIGLRISTNAMTDAVTYIQCCGGKVCSDTYYTVQDNLCHLSLCENSFLTDHSNCSYEGANISITTLT